MKLLCVKRAFPNNERREEKLARTLARCLQALVAICVTVSAVHVANGWLFAPAIAAKNSEETQRAEPGAFQDFPSRFVNQAIELEEPIEQF